MDFSKEGRDRGEMVGGNATGGDVKGLVSEGQRLGSYLKEANVSELPLDCQAPGLL
jgi:hypothetical protein